MLDRQTYEEAKERLDHLHRLDARNLLDTPDLQALLKEQADVTRRLQRKRIEAQLRGE